MQIKILVTGGTGLVGAELIKQLLESGNYVTAIYNKTPLPPFNDLRLSAVKCDILDPVALEEAMDGITNVYHCAAIVSFTPKYKKKLFAVNIEGTANIVNAAIDARVEKLVHVSSVSALGRKRSGEAISEKMQWTEENSNSLYGKSKFLGEMEVWRGIGEGLNAIIVNPSLILGPGDWTKGSSELFKSAYEEFPWYTDGASGFVDVRDVAKAMILLMNSELTNERFILSGENASYQNIFTEIAKCFGKKPPHKKVSTFIAELVWRWEAIKSTISGKDALLTKETIRTAQTKVYYDNSKIRKNLPGFEFRSLTDTIAYTCDQLKALNHL